MGFFNGGMADTTEGTTEEHRTFSETLKDDNLFNVDQPEQSPNTNAASATTCSNDYELYVEPYGCYPAVKRDGQDWVYL